MPFIGKSPQVGAFQLIDSITTSATDTYALTVSGSAYVPESARNLIVSLNGVTQAPESAYTVSGSNIVFASALTASDVIDYILVIGDAVDIGTPSDNTVGDAQLKPSLNLSSKTLTFANDQISGDVINGGTISSFASTGIDDNATSTALTVTDSGIAATLTTAAQPNITSVGTLTGFTSTGIDDNATSTKLTVSDTGIDVTGTADVDGTVNSRGLQAKGSPSLSFNASNWMTQQETGVARTYICGPDASTYQPWEIYRATSTGGASLTMKLDASGSVGIGTTSPSSFYSGARQLVVGSGSGEQGITLYSGSASTAYLLFADGTSGTNLYAGQVNYNHSTNAMSFCTNEVTTARMLINSSGNVGIGTSSPAYRLDAQVSDNTWAARVLNTRATDGNGLLVRSDSTNDPITLGVYGNGAYRMVVLADGNVGIGTTSPSSALHVDSSNDGPIFDSGGTGNTNHALLVRDSANNQLLRVNNNGLIGIGTTSPSALLDLVGPSSTPLVLELNTANSNCDITMQSASTSSVTRLRNGINDFQVHTNGTQRMTVTASGQLVVPVMYSDTTSDAANVNVRSDGLIRRSTSSRRYKNSITDATHGVTELLALRSVTYKGNSDGDRIFGGLIAEEVHEAGLTEFVQYDSEGNPDALAYGPMIALCVKAIQEQQAMIETLEAEVATLKGE